MDEARRAAISKGQRRRYAHLRALKRSHDRMLRLLAMCEAVVRERAAEGDSLATYIVAEIDRASDDLQLTGIIATTDLRSLRNAQDRARGQEPQGHAADAVTVRGGAT